MNHILNTTALHDILEQVHPLRGKQAVFPDHLVEGPLKHIDEPYQWLESRSQYLMQSYDREISQTQQQWEDYFGLLRSSTDEIYLWFEYDLQSQLHLWATAYWAAFFGVHHEVDFFWLRPTAEHPFSFVDHNPAMIQQIIIKRRAIKAKDLHLLSTLFKAYIDQSPQNFSMLEPVVTHFDPTLKGVFEAIYGLFEQDVDQFNRPERCMRRILLEGGPEISFQQASKVFNVREPIYGASHNQRKQWYGKVYERVYPSLDE